jgi:putative ABC transport system ATP-binding protein
LCNRLEVPTSGVVTHRGEPLATLDVLRHRRQVGMVFQRSTLFAGTVLDNLRVADPGLDRVAASALLEAVRLDPTVADQQADTLSGGEAQRACVARTLATEPRVILMDEATSALDADNRRGLEQLARDLLDAGISIVWVSHDDEQVRRIADVILRVEDGLVVEVETR